MKKLHGKIGRLITQEQVIQYFEEKTGVTLEEIKSKDSKFRVVDVRKAMLPILEECCNFRFTDIMVLMNKSSGVINNYMVNIKPRHMETYSKAKHDLTRTVNNFRKL